MVDKLAKTILDNIVSKNKYKYKSHNKSCKDRHNNMSENEENLLVSLLDSKSKVNSIGNLTIDDLVSSYSKAINKRAENKNLKDNENVKLSLETLRNSYIKNRNEDKKNNTNINNKIHNNKIHNNKISKKTITLKELEKMYKQI